MEIIVFIKRMEIRIISSILVRDIIVAFATEPGSSCEKMARFVLPLYYESNL